jgi:hypothetical protein
MGWKSLGEYIPEVEIFFAWLCEVEPELVAIPLPGRRITQMLGNLKGQPRRAQKGRARAIWVKACRQLSFEPPDP